MQLSPNQTDYVFDHLKHHWVPDQRVADAFVVVESGHPLPTDLRGKIVFVLSGEDQPQPVIVNFEGENIPVLFPLSKKASLFQMDEAGNLWFSHDYLSSVFYLLSGIQELNEGNRDAYGRFQYAGSIQNTYNFVSKPVVNYYFDFLLKGFECFSHFHHFEIKRRRLFESFGFLLSHDVDRVAYHHSRLVLYKTLQVLGLRPVSGSKSRLITELIASLRYHFSPGYGKDPWWTFPWMMELEKRLGIRSTFYFLQKENGYKNAWFNLFSKKISNLIRDLKREGFEVAVHGTFKTVTDGQSLKHQKAALAKVYGEEPAGIRQHYLLFLNPSTFQIQEAAGLLYDSTLSFHDHDGYRNGYCYPFHPYDFEKDGAMKIWEIPLVMMEVSALQYRKLSYSELTNRVSGYIQEAKKFGGIFSLLWHNCRLNDDEYVGISMYYEGLLNYIVNQGTMSLTGKGLIERVTKQEEVGPD